MASMIITMRRWRCLAGKSNIDKVRLALDWCRLTVSVRMSIRRMRTYVYVCTWVQTGAKLALVLRRAGLPCTCICWDFFEKLNAYDGRTTLGGYIKGVSLI